MTISRMPAFGLKNPKPALLVPSIRAGSDTSIIHNTARDHKKNVFSHDRRDVLLQRLAQAGSKTLQVEESDISSNDRKEEEINH